MKKTLCVLSIALSLTAGQVHADMNNYPGYTSGEIGEPVSNYV